LYVKEEGQYANLDENAKYESRKYAFGALDRNPALMNLGTALDMDLQAFYESTLAGNVGVVFLLIIFMFVTLMHYVATMIAT
jgi:hypothetical protein